MPQAGSKLDQDMQEKDKELKSGSGGSGEASSGAPADQGSESAGEGANPTPSALKYTDEDVDSIVARIIAKERSKAEAALAAKEKELTEAQKLEKMTEDEQAAYKTQKLEEEIAELKRERSLNEQMAVARKDLTDNGINLPDELLSMFVSPSADETKAAIDKVKDLWPKAINEAVKNELKRNPPLADPPEGKAPSEAASFAKEWSQKHAPEMKEA